MKKFKWIYGILAAVTTITLLGSFFAHDVNPINQVILLVQSVGFSWICGAYSGADA